MDGASSLMHYGQVLIEYLPELADVFVAGLIDFRVIRIVEFRTGLLTDAQAIAAIDEMLAYKAPAWNVIVRRPRGAVGGLDGARSGSRRTAGG